MAHGEKYQAIAPEQHGSRKRLSSIQEASVNNRVMYDIMCQHRHGGVMCSNDTKSCYDRIVHSVLSLSLQWLGVPTAPIQSIMLTTIQKMHQPQDQNGIWSLHSTTVDSTYNYLGVVMDVPNGK